MRWFDKYVVCRVNKKYLVAAKNQMHMHLNYYTKFTHLKFELIESNPDCMFLFFSKVSMWRVIRCYCVQPRLFPLHIQGANSNVRISWCSTVFVEKESHITHFASASTSLNMSDDATTPEGFDKVPDEILVKIMSYIQHDHFRNVRLVNRRFNRVSYTPSLWKTVRILIYCRNVEIWIDARWMFEKIEG